LVAYLEGPNLFRSGLISNEGEVECYAVLDDYLHMEHLEPNHILTCNDQGLTLELADKCIEHLNRKE